MKQKLITYSDSLHDTLQEMALDTHNGRVGTLIRMILEDAARLYKQDRDYIHAMKTVNDKEL